MSTDDSSASTQTCTPGECRKRLVERHEEEAVRRAEKIARGALLDVEIRDQRILQLIEHSEAQGAKLADLQEEIRILRMRLKLASEATANLTNPRLTWQEQTQTLNEIRTLVNEND